MATATREKKAMVGRPGGPLDGEPLITLADAAASEGKSDAGAIRRWEKWGIAGVTLETENRGDRVYTSEAALRRFSAAVRVARRPVTTRREQERTPAQTKEAARRAEAELQRLHAIKRSKRGRRPAVAPAG